MKKTLVAALAAATATAGIALSTQAHGQSDGTTLKLVDHNTGFAFNDVKPKKLPKKDSLGDTLTVTGRLTGDRTGTSTLICTVDKAGRKGHELCQGLAKLSDGSIAFSGRSNQDDSPSPMAITGGTGAYTGASGTIATKDGKHDTTLVTVTLGS